MSRTRAEDYLLPIAAEEAARRRGEEAAAATKALAALQRTRETRSQRASAAAIEAEEMRKRLAATEASLADARAAHRQQRHWHQHRVHELIAQVRSLQTALGTASQAKEAELQEARRLLAETRRGIEAWGAGGLAGGGFAGTPRDGSDGSGGSSGAARRRAGAAARRDGAGQAGAVPSGGEDLDDSIACIICACRPRSYALMPCGHLLLCEDPHCRRTFEYDTRCPACRSETEYLHRIFL